MSLIIDKRKYNSRLIIGSGKYKDYMQTKNALDASGAEMITVELKRTNMGQKKNQKNLLIILIQLNIKSSKYGRVL